MTTTQFDSGPGEREAFVTPGDKIPFVLASSSGARLRILRNAGIDPEVIVSGADETVEAGLDTAAAVGILAERKAAAVAAGLPMRWCLAATRCLTSRVSPTASQIRRRARPSCGAGCPAGPGRSSPGTA